jgi:radical SAM superfamily enzyme YgiQ (UPF0313 family)
MKFLFVHSWQGFCLAEWYLREAISSNCKVDTHFQSIDIPSNGIPATDELERIILSWKPELIGFSCHFWSINTFIETSGWIKKINPKINIVFGGPQVNSIHSAQNILESQKNIDYIIRGPGEESICKLIENIVLNKSKHTVPGLSYINAGEIVHNEVLGFCNWKRSLIFHQGNSQLVEHILPLDQISYETTKGCYSKCIYCYYPIDRFEILDDERIFSELSFICSLKIKNLRICDTHFGGTKERAKRILRHLAKINHHISIKIYPDLHHIDEEYIQLIRDAGAQITSVGIQTTNPLALKKINREALHHMDHQIGLIIKEFSEVPADLMIGLPGDDIRGLEKSFMDILSLGFSAVNIFRLMIFPGTQLSENLSEYFDPAKTVISPQGRLIYSSNFPLKDQKKISNFIYAIEIICWMLWTRKIILSASERIEKFIKMTKKLDSDQLIDLHKDVSMVEHLNNNAWINLISEKIQMIFKDYNI